MLRLLVESAVKWMKTGLPLRSLKIVVYSPNPNKAAFSKNPVFQRFEKLKEELGEKEVESAVCSHTIKSHFKALGVYNFIRGFGRAYKPGGCAYIRVGLKGK